MENSNMETWLTISSSDDEAYDSDKIDSDIEAELYSVIHHEADTTKHPDNNSNYQEAQINTSPMITNNSPVRQDPQIDTFPKVTINSPKIDLINLEDTELYTSFETPERKQIFSDSSSDGIMILDDFDKKRKSDVLDDSLEIMQQKTLEQTSNTSSKKGNAQKKQRTKNLNKSNNGQLSNNRTIEIDSSDSDSIIYWSSDDCNVKLETNLDDSNILELSSCSFSSEDSFSPFLANNSLNGNRADVTQPSTSSFNENSNDPWFIISEDLYRSKKQSGRYHQRAVLQCTNCSLKGHSAKFCSLPKVVKCFICGGAHGAMKCKDKVCHKCLRIGHDSRFCPQRSIGVCVHCNMKGHLAKNCPDLWRRYHLTTNQKKIIVGNPIAQTTPIYCFSCGDKGHYGSKCQVPRNDRFCFPTWTSVISYLHPSESMQRASEIQRNTQLGEVPNFNQPSPNISQMQPYFNRIPPANFNRIPPANYNRIPPANYNRIPPANFNRSPAPRQFPPREIQRSMAKLRKKKKKNKANITPQTTNSTKKKKKSQKEVYFPRTPKQSSPGSSNQLTPTQKKKLRRAQNQKKLQAQQQKKDHYSFVNGLHRRLGLQK